MCFPQNDWLALALILMSGPRALAWAGEAPTASIGGREGHPWRPAPIPRPHRPRAGPNSSRGVRVAVVLAVAVVSEEMAVAAGGEVNGGRATVGAAAVDRGRGDGPGRLRCRRRGGAVVSEAAAGMVGAADRRRRACKGGDGRAHR